MKEAFEKIRKRIEDVRMGYFLTIANGGDERNDVVYEGISKATDHALSIVSEVEAEYGNGWIDVKDKLPKNTDDVLVTTAYGLVIDAYLSTQKNWCFRNGTRITDSADMPIAWMPLPEPYKPTND